MDMFIVHISRRGDQRTLKPGTLHNILNEAGYSNPAIEAISLMLSSQLRYNEDVRI